MSLAASDNKKMPRLSFQGIDATAAGLQHKIAAYNIPSSQMQGLLYALKQAGVSGAIGVGLGVAFPALIHCFCAEKGSFIDNTLEGSKFFVLYNLLNGLTQGLLTGLVAGAGTTLPEVSSNDMALIHTIHHVLTDCGIFIVSEASNLDATAVLLVPAALAALEAVAIFFKRCDISSERIKLEEFLAAIPTAKLNKIS